MGEESEFGGYVKFGDSECEPIGHITMDEITEEEPEDHFVTEFIRTFWREPVEGSIKVLLQRKGIRKLYKHIGFPEYWITEWLFPKKKKRGTARRLRRARKGKGWMKSLVFYGYKTDEPIIDEFYIPPVDPSTAIPESEYKFVMSNDANGYVFAGPFEGEEDI